MHRGNCCKVIYLVQCVVLNDFGKFMHVPATKDLIKFVYSINITLEHLGLSFIPLLSEKLVSLALFLVLGVGLQAESFLLQSQILIWILVRVRAFLSIRATGPGPLTNWCLQISNYCAILVSTFIFLKLFPPAFIFSLDTS